MYWCNLTPGPSPSARGFLFLGTLIFIATISSCKPDIKEAGAPVKFFDIAGYFKADSARLRVKNPAVTKTVIHNGQSQTQKVSIANWGAELDPFITSDINKPAWRDAYNIQTGENIVVYVAKLPELKTREVVIKKVGGQLVWIQIYNHTKNMLYEDTQKLIYFPDSLYIISKSQKVRLLGRNDYYIKGKLN